MEAFLGPMKKVHSAGFICLCFFFFFSKISPRLSVIYLLFNSSDVEEQRYKLGDSSLQYPTIRAVPSLPNFAHVYRLTGQVFK